MATKIEWTDRTWNPLAGCTMVSRACENCYAMRMAFRLEQMGQDKYKGTTRKTEGGKIVWSGKINFDEKALLEPLKWKKPQRVFVNSMSDLFHEDVNPYWIDHVFALMAATPHITYQILTKRPDRMAEYLNDEDLGHDLDDSARRLDLKIPFKWPLPNVWLGTTIENQKEADKRIYHLIKCPAAVRFVSCEPLVGPIDLTKVRRADVETLPNYRYDCLRAGTWTSGFYPGEFVNHSDVCDEVIHWVIAGGESGPKAEPSHPDWFRSLRDQCEAAEVPFFFKQWGEWCPIGQIQNDESVRGFTSYKVFDTETCSHRVGKNAAGNFLDGKEWNKFPKGRNEVQNG